MVSRFCWIVCLVVLTSHDAGAAEVARPRLVLGTGHTAEILAAAFSPDGRLVATASRDGTAKLWEPQNGRLLFTFVATGVPVMALAFSRDGSAVVTASQDGGVALWSTSTGSRLAEIEPSRAAEAAPLTAAALSIGESGLWVAGAGKDRTIRLWRVKGSVKGGGELVASLAGHEKPVGALAFSSDANALASGSADGLVKLWDTEDGALQRTLRGHAMPIRSVCFSSDGKTVADASDDGNVQLWDAVSGQRRETLQMNRPGDGAGAVAFSSDGARLVTGGHAGYKGNEFLQIWDRAAARVARTPQGHTDWVGAVAFSPDGTLIASGSRDHTLRIWSAVDGRLLATAGTTDATPAVAFSPDGRWIATGAADSLVRLWDSRTGELARVYRGHAGAVRAVAFSPDGRSLASGGADHAVRRWNTETGLAVRVYAGATAPVNAVTFSPDGSVVAAGTGASGADGEVRLWETESGNPRPTFTGQFLSTVRSLAFSPDGAVLVTGSGYWTRGEVRFWSLETGAILAKEYTHSVQAVRFSADGKKLVTGSGVFNEQGAPVGDEVQLWNARTRELERTFTAAGPDARTNALAFAADKKTLASGSRDGSIRLWNLATGEIVTKLAGHTGPVLGMSLSQDGARLATVGADNTLRIWRLGPTPGSAAALATLVTPGGREAQAQGEWLAVTDAGYYDGSPGAARYINWRVGPDLFPVEAYEKTFRRPDMLRNSLQDNPLTESPELRQFVPGGDVPPRVQFSRPREGERVEGDRLQVDVSVTDDRKVVRVDLLANGRPIGAKPIEVGAKPIEVGAKSIEIGAKAIEIGAKPIEVGAKPAPAAHETSQQFRAEVALPPGTDSVKLTAVAYDDQGLTTREDVQVDRAGGAGAPGRLLVLAVGVSRYRDERLNLKYAGRDAHAFAEMWRSGAASLYGGTEVVTLSDDQATAAGVRAALFKLLETAAEKDTVTLFLSGHGVRLDDGEYYFATHEIDTSSQGRVAETALKWTALATTLESLRARRVLLFLDACHSGGVLPGIRASNERLGEALAKHSGVMVFASSRGSEFSYELDAQKHGAFTTALLEALGEQKANLEIGGQRDEVITSAELLAYLSARVPQLTENRQNPTCPLVRDFGDAFPLLRTRR